MGSTKFGKRHALSCKHWHVKVNLHYTYTYTYTYIHVHEFPDHNNQGTVLRHKTGTTSFTLHYNIHTLYVGEFT